MIFSLYFPILLSISLFVLLHAFKKHIHSFFSLFTNDNHKLHLKCQHHCATNKYSKVMDTETVAAEAAEKPSDPDPPPPIDDCVDEMQFHDRIDSDDDDNEDECWRRMEAVEGRGIWRNEEAFPPLISSLNGNGQRNFVLVPERKNGRLQLCRVRVKRPEILHATRQDGRLRLFMVPDQRDNDEEVGEETKEELLVELEEVGESKYDDVEEEEDRKIGEWNKFHSEGGFRRCHEMLNHVHGSYHNLLVSIA